MKLAIMQPYFLPYIGYFQLVQAVDTFVIYDDVNYIKGGWINRNFILSQGEKTRVTLQLLGASPNQLINQVAIGHNREKLKKTLQQSYARSPYFAERMPLFEDILGYGENNLAAFLDYGLRQICDSLGIEAEWHLSSDLQKDNTLRGQDKVLAICKELGASEYINMPGGMELYDHETFNENGIALYFLNPQPFEYTQSGNPFVPSLSIVDVMMFNSLEKCQELVKEYELVR